MACQNELVCTDGMQKAHLAMSDARRHLRMNMQIRCSIYKRRDAESLVKTWKTNTKLHLQILKKKVEKMHED